MKAHTRGVKPQQPRTSQVMRLVRYRIRVTDVFLKPKKYGIVSGDAKTRHTDP